jgi:signal transduction histidine kinase/DNA-binding response OmpR family regulator
MPDRASILIVDDRPDKLLALEAVLEDLGPNIVRAYSGREALRQVLQHEFAVILLDVNMPDMDGFETAALIRQRKNSESTPIIFITSFGDEMHAARGYSLGAVDYIQAPVVPDVLRTKVTVFVELFTKTEQVKRQAESLRRRASQLQNLAAASVAINAASSIEKMLQIVTDTARDVIGAHQAITYLAIAGAGAGRSNKGQAFTSFSDRYADWKDRELRLDAVTETLVAQSRSATRMTESELLDHPDWEIVKTLEIPPVKGGMLAAPLTGRDGANFGVIYMSDRYEGTFSHDDEAIIVQLAQMASVAIENSLYAEEREANRMKDEFLATLSHELRTPLNAILGWTQLLRLQQKELTGRKSHDPAIAIPKSVSEAMAEVGHGLEVIERNARSQTKLIEDLLDVSRITTGKMRLSGQVTAIGPVVLAAADVVRPSVEAKRIQLSCTIEPDATDAAVFCDTDRLQQVFWNLLSNAVKFTEPGGRVEARLLKDDAGTVRFIVRDTGRGIDPKFLPHVFDRFRQADSSSTRSHGGLGIGLTIVRHIVELHGGSVRAESSGEGQGATFSVTLPLAATSAPSESAKPPTATNADVESPQPAAGRNGNRTAAAPRNGTGALSGLKILLVDDEPDGREVVRQTLNRFGAEVEIASSAAEAMELLSAAQPDLLISDIAMPDEDGYALVRRVRSLAPEAGGKIPAIALSAYSRDEDRQRALTAGFQSHVAKPVEPEELLQAVLPWKPEKKPETPALRLARESA